MKQFITLLFVVTLSVNCVYGQFDPTEFEGMWRGTWYNNTFGSTDSAFLSITIDQGMSTLEAVLDLDGNVFGGSDPDPVTLTGSYNSNGFSAMGNSPTYGDMFLSGDDNGNMSGRMPNVPNPGIDSTTLSGTYNETNMDLAYIVYFVGGSGTADGVINLVKDQSSSVEQIPGNPAEYLVNQNYPNPFNPSTTITFSIPEESFVSLKIFNSLGEEVETLVAEGLSVGNYKYDWSAVNLSSGVYFYKLQAENFVESKKMILLK